MCSNPTKAISAITAKAVLLFIVFYSLALVLVPQARTNNVLEILAPAGNRETGLIETLQHFVLLLLLIRLFFILYRTGLRMAPILSVLLTGFIFLEETDYLMHYLDFFSGNRPYAFSLNGFRNFHNAGSSVSFYKIAYWICVLCTFIFTWRKLAGSRDRRERYMLGELLFSLLLIQVLLSIAGVAWLNGQLGDSRQVVSETLELHLYTSWLLLLSYPSASMGSRVVRQLKRSNRSII